MSVLRLAIVGVFLVASIGCSCESGRMVLDDGSAVTEAMESSLPTPTAAARKALMRGLFTYMADAAVFEECESGRRYPVAMEAGYLELERAYLESRSEPGAPLLVSFAGHLAERPPMEGDGPIDMIVVDRFESARPGENCEGGLIR